MKLLFKKIELKTIRKLGALKNVVILREPHLHSFFQRQIKLSDSSDFDHLNKKLVRKPYVISIIADVLRKYKVYISL